MPAPPPPPILLALGAILALMLLPTRSRASPYLSKHRNRPLNLKDEDAPMDLYQQQYLILNKYGRDKYTQYPRIHANNYPDAVLRPEPSDELPIMPLEFPANAGSLPTTADLHPRRLRKMLPGYDVRFMSVEEPLDSILRPNGTLVYKFKDGKPSGRMPREFRSLKFKIPERRTAIRIKNRKDKRKLQEFLWAYSYCPILYKWRNLGQLFWPKWIKEGSCYSKRSCSFPAGMTCQPKGKVVKELLFWHCKSSKCKWIKIQYPIITECSCAC